MTTTTMMMSRGAAVGVALVIMSLGLGWSSGGRIPDFFVEGKVYCDMCRAGFITNATTTIQGAKVRLECRHFMSPSGAVERSAEGLTDAKGNYRIELEDNRGSEEVCTVRLVSSPMPGCDELEVGRDRAPVMLVDASLANMVRRTNPLGFLKEQPLPDCRQILSSLALRTAPNY